MSSEAPDQPPLLRDAAGNVDVDSVPDVIDWFLNYDQRVAVIKHPSVEEVFHWKQQQSQAEGEEVFIFNHAEDRLAIGIIQALADNVTERELHAWIGILDTERGAVRPDFPQCADVLERESTGINLDAEFTLR